MKSEMIELQETITVTEHKKMVLTTIHGIEINLALFKPKTKREGIYERPMAYSLSLRTNRFVDDLFVSNIDWCENRIYFVMNEGKLPLKIVEPFAFIEEKSCKNIEEFGKSSHAPSLLQWNQMREFAAMATLRYKRNIEPFLLQHNLEAVPNDDTQWKFYLENLNTYKVKIMNLQEFAKWRAELALEGLYDKIKKGIVKLSLPEGTSYRSQGYVQAYYNRYPDKKKY